MPRAELHVVHLRAAVRHAEQVLAPALGPSDRTPDLVREPGDHELFRVHAALGAEAAADPRRADAHLVGVESERARDLALDTEHRLRRRPHGERSIGLGDRDAAVRLHRDRRHALVLHERPHHDVGVGEEVVVGSSATAPDEVGAVRRKEQRRAVGGGRDRIGDRGKRVDLHGDCLGGVERLGEGAGEHDRDRLPDEPHPVDRQQWSLERLVARERALAGQVEIGGGPDRVDAVTLGRGRGVHRLDDTVGHMGSDEHRVQRALDLEVGHEAGAAVEQAGVLRAKHRMTEDRSRRAELPTHVRDVNVCD